MRTLFFLPFVSALFALLFVSSKRWAFVLSMLPLVLFALCGTSWIGQSVDTIWLQNLSIHFHIAVDSLSFIFLWLVYAIVPIAVLASNPTEKHKAFYSLLLLVQGLAAGFFMAQDLVFFTFFFEAMLIPLYFLIMGWGGKKRAAAAVKFIVYMVAGSTLMIMALLSLYFSAGSFDLVAISKKSAHLSTAPILTAIFLLAFLVKTPIFGLHAWLADAYCEAETAGSILLSAVLSKAGIYGIIRICMGLFPAVTAEWSPVLVLIAIIGVLYGALAAWGQTDFKRLIAYSSLSHINFVLAGLFVWNYTAQSGAILQAVNHSITISGLFLVAAWLSERVGTTQFDALSGLAAYLPRLCWLTLFFVLSSIALPGLNNFVSELMLLLGVFSDSPWYALLLGSTVILSVLYMLKFQQNLYFEVACKKQESFTDIGSRELMAAMPLVLVVVWLGIYPKPALEVIEPAAQSIVKEGIVSR